MSAATLARRPIAVRIAASADAARVGYTCRVDRIMLVGRSLECDLTVRDPSVSRRHARLEPVQGGLRVVDLGSANGVLVGGDQVADVVLAPGQRFVLGETEVECWQPASAADAPASPGDGELPDTLIDVAAAPPRQPAEEPAPIRLEEAGQPARPETRRPFLLDDPTRTYYVTSGRLRIFTVALDGGVPTDTRHYIADVPAGGLAIGFDLSAIGWASGFLAVPEPGTDLREISRTELQRIGLSDPQAVDALLDTWVAALTQAFAASPPEDRPVTWLRPGSRCLLPQDSCGQSPEGVAWVEISSGHVLVNGTSLATFDGATAWFPVSTTTWIGLARSGTAATPLAPERAHVALSRPGFWPGVDGFHRMVCEWALVGKVVAVVEEYDRLAEKARRSEAAEAAAYRAIGSVLGTETLRPGEVVDAAAQGPVLGACRIIGDFLGIPVRALPTAPAHAGYDEMVQAVASASGLRVREVALRGDWWRGDQGPLLCKHAETKAPVALLPVRARGYLAVDPRTGHRQPVTSDVAASLDDFAYSIYRPFPTGPVTLGGLVRFGALGIARDAWTLALMAVAIGLFGAVTPYLTGQVFSVAIPQADRAMLLGFAVALFVAATARSVFQFVQGVATLRIQTRMSASIQAAVWDRLLNLPVEFFRKYEAGDLADRASGVDEIQGLVAGAGVAAVLGSLSGVFYVGQMFVYSLSLALTAIVLTGTYVGVTMAFNYVQLRYQRIELALRGRITGLVLNLITGVSKLRTSGAEQHAFLVWAKQFAEQRRVAFRVGTIQNLAVTFITAFFILSSMVVFTVILREQEAAVAMSLPALSTGDFIAFNAAFGLFLAAMQSLGDASLNMLRVVPVYERLRPLLDAEPEADQSKALPDRLNGAIELSRVWFRYDADGPWVIEDVSLRIAPGEFVAFVGESGCGKSTLMRLMLGFERPARGTITYDGHDLASFDLRLVRQQFGVVLQDSRVMPSDIYRNITGSTSRTLEEAWNAAEQAGLADDIREMPMGMHTYVSEGGGTLSGGQRQRLMIARAIVNRPKVVFLDEATSALDNRAQAIVTESFDRMDATRVVIAHRLSTIINADRICYLEGGRVVEMGTYHELMATNGRFAALARRQMV